MNRQKEFVDKYHHALDRMWQLFVHGQGRERELAINLRTARDALKKVLTFDGLDDDIESICRNALEHTNEASEL